jgi:hypothetical protein
MPFPAIWAKFYKITKIYSSIMFWTTCMSF